MEATSLLQSFAIAKDGRVVSVNEVERGQSCGCTCPSCLRPLIARQGDVRVWHFAHAIGADCEGGAESALHLAAKAAIERAGGVALWSPYDAQFNEVVKTWCRDFGGRWQRAHKNWLFPVEAKPFLVAEIAKRQTRPPEKRA